MCPVQACARHHDSVRQLREHVYLKHIPTDFMSATVRSQKRALELISHSLQGMQGKLVADKRRPLEGELSWTARERSAVQNFAISQDIALSEHSLSQFEDSILTALNWEAIMWTLAEASTARQMRFKDHIMELTLESRNSKVERQRALRNRRRRLRREKYQSASQQPSIEDSFEEREEVEVLGEEEADVVLLDLGEAEPARSNSDRMVQLHPDLRGLDSSYWAPLSIQVQQDADLIDFGEEDMVVVDEVQASEPEEEEVCADHQVNPSFSNFQSSLMPQSDFSDRSERTLSDLDPVPFFDAHMHLDRLAKARGLSPPFSMDSVLSACQFHSDIYDQLFQISGMVTSFCDPESYLDMGWDSTDYMLSDDRLFLSFGVHPKKIWQVTTREGLRPDFVNRLRQCMSRKNVVAFGEIGIDLTSTQATLAEQENGLISLLKEFKDELTTNNTPLVLHCRNGPQSEADAALSVMAIVSQILGNAQPIQLHYFQGNSAEVLQWLDNFPNTYFSIPVQATMPINPHQEDGWRKIPLDRLLLETDAQWKISPIDLPLDCDRLAECLGINKRDLLRITYQNAREFFGIPYTILPVPLLQATAPP